MAKWLQGTIRESHCWSENLYSIKIQCEPIDFKAGQFVNIALDLNNKRVARPYSLVNTPDEPLLEVHFNAVPHGTLSPALARLKAGDAIQVSDRAAGLLTLDQIPEVPHLWLLATGTGIGPFLSLLKTPEPWQRFDNIILAYSVKTLDRLAYKTDFDSLLSQYPDKFHFFPCITREQVEGSIHARITHCIENAEFEKRAGLTFSPDSSHVMLCGNAKMIAEVTELLQARGLRKHSFREAGHIATEKYY